LQFFVRVVAVTAVPPSVSDMVETAEEVDRACKYHYEHPFLIVSHVVEDIGLVGWNNKRWTHQDKVRRDPNHAPASRTQASGWKQAFDPDHSKYYFYNTTLGITTWEEPGEKFDADDTVAYYVQLGIAPPWKRSIEQRSSNNSACQSHEAVQQVDFVPVSAAACVQPDCAIADQCSDFVPASEKFAPTKKGELEPNVERYWILRYSLFSRWSSGVYLDETSLFSVTPEVIAKHHARMLKGGSSVLDAFCGCGGNTIALAQCFEKVRSAPSSPCSFSCSPT
jgi:hypothetical protein